MADVARKHHTVPHFYLKGFASSSRQIGTVQLAGTRRFLQATRAATTHNDFYAVPGHEEGPDVFEKHLSRLEADAAAVIRKVTDAAVWPLPQADREVLALFITVQFLRGPEQRRHMEQTVAHMTRMEIGYGGKANVAGWAKRKHGITVSEEQAAQIWEQATKPNGPPIRMAAVGHINQMLELVPQFVRYFEFRPWQLIKFSKRSLLTCDTPISLVPHMTQPAADESLQPFEPTGLLNAWGITFPLSRKVGLLMANPDELIGHVSAQEVATGALDIQQDASTAMARLFNDSTIGNARRWIFHHPDDAHVVPKVLPDPTTDEVHVSGGLPEFSGEPVFGLDSSAAE